MTTRRPLVSVARNTPVVCAALSAARGGGGGGGGRGRAAAQRNQGGERRPPWSAPVSVMRHDGSRCAEERQYMRSPHAAMFRHKSSPPCRLCITTAAAARAELVTVPGTSGSALTREETTCLH